MAFEIGSLQLIGFAGFLLVFIAFALNFLKRVRRFSLVFNVLNFAGSVLLAYYAFQISDLVFLVVNAVWAIIALFFVLMRLFDKDPTHELSDIDIDYAHNWGK
ncbi:MAG: hypothetical protein Q7R47_04530 [Candidatus Diapherotrites archaeon]|nr:hypothetical protein [Candidatus Diapherotrites archaeon]